jgi:arylsulfatase A-like enzyme
MGAWYQKAFGVMQSGRFRDAFALDKEPLRVRERYGRHLFGQGCLLARRMADAGVALTAVYWHYEGPDDSPVWDTHQNNFAHLRKRLMPPTDQAFAALLDDLAVRGMLDDTLVVCMGEFGRTPKVNKHAGRDHWAAAQSIVFAGAGIRAGTVYGATDRTGGYPADNPVSPADVTATILHLLGVSPALEISDRAGRPFRACHGKPIAGVLA